MGNPYDKTRSAGGSSSGCGVLIALGEADLAIGGDQGGSIRLVSVPILLTTRPHLLAFTQPASHVGIVGLKPTFGLVPYTGIVSNEVSLDHTGPMSPDVLSNALLLRAIAGTDGIDDRQIAGTPSRAHVPDYPALLAAARTRGALLQVGLPSDATGTEPGQTRVRKMRIGILKEGGMCQAADPRVTDCVAGAAKKFEKLGAEVVEVSVPGHLGAALIGRVHRYVYGCCQSLSMEAESDAELAYFRFSQANNMLGRASGMRQLYLTDFMEKVLPWDQEKFDKVLP